MIYANTSNTCSAGRSTRSARARCTAIPTLPSVCGIGGLNFEHRFVNAGFEYLDTADRTSITKPEVDGQGYSIWLTPKSSMGLEALLRYDRLTPNTSVKSQKRNRTIVGVAYWFPHQGTVSSALLLDYDGQTFDNFLPAQPKQSRIGVHGLISF